MNKTLETDTYILPTGKADQERLKILNEVYEKYSKASFDRIGLKKGQKVAIFGCGSGECIDYIHQKIGNEGKLLCIDISPEQVALTKEVLTEKGILNVEYKVADIQDVKGDESYDLAYCRFVLIHVKQPRKGIENMLSFVKSRGFIACEEFSANYKYCYPELKAFQKIMEISKRIREKLGRDNRYGEKLYHEMLNFDVEPIHFEFNMPISNSARNKQRIIMSWEEIKKKGVISGVASDEEIDGIISELKKYQHDESAFQGVGSLFQYIGRKRQINIGINGKSDQHIKPCIKKGNNNRIAELKIEIKSAVKSTKTNVIKELETKYKYETQLKEKDSNATIELLKQTIGSLKEKLSEKDKILAFMEKQVGTFTITGISKESSRRSIICRQYKEYISYSGF